MSGLIGFICYRDAYDHSEHYGVSVEAGKVVEWWAKHEHNGSCSCTANYSDMAREYGDPELFESYDPRDFEWVSWEKFDQECDKLLNLAKEMAVEWTS